MSLTCEQLIAVLGDYLARELPASQAGILEQHLARCASCVEYVATYRETILMSRASAAAPELRVEDVPDELVQAILAAARAGP